MKQIFSLIAMLFLASYLLFAGTTGKISGRVTDAETGEPLFGANVIVEGTIMGGAADADGRYMILNVPPGTYRVKAMMIGYTPVTYENVRVNIDLTTTVNFELSVEAIMGEEIVVVAERKVIKEDVASSQINLSSNQIDALPVISIEEVVGLQAGVEGLSIRHGDVDEVALLMDGISLKDSRTGEPVTGIPLSSVEEIMIQSGGFNAEYGDLQAGVINVVTREGNPQKYTVNFNVRYSPPAPKHFGPSIYSKDSYFLRPFLDDEVCWTGTDNGAWDEFTQSQYPAFSGWISKSEDLINDDNPDNDLTPYGAQRLFMWEHRREGNITKPDYDIDIGLGGPVPFVSEKLGKLRFYTSYKNQQDMYLVPLSRDAYRDWSWTLKLTSDITPKIKFQINTFLKNVEASSSSETGAPSYFINLWDVAGVMGNTSQIESKIWYPEYYCRTDVNSGVVSAKLTHILSHRSFYEGVVEYSKTSYSTYPGRDRNLDPIYDIFPGEAVYMVDESPYGYDWRLSTGINGFMTGAKSNSRDSTETGYLKLRFDYTNQFNDFNQLKTGVQFEYYDYDMNYGAVNPALPSGRPWTKWSKNPFQLGFYIQDKLEFEGWIATIGLRVEHFNPNTEWYDVDKYDKMLYSSRYRPYLEDEIPTKKTEPYTSFLPRLGISHPITVNSKLYFNYGHMRQKFRPDQLFGIRRITGYQVTYIGDPELPTEKTISYELGYDHSLFDKYLLHIAAYYKDKSDQMGTILYQSADNTVSYSKYSNNFYQDIMGFEFEIRKNIGDWVTGFFNYTYSIYSSGYFGLREYHENPSDQKRVIQNVSAQAQYKPIPRPKLNFNIAFSTPVSWGPTIGTHKYLGGWKLSFMGYWRAGSYATYGNVTGVTNNVQWRDSYNVDLRIAKTFSFGKFNLMVMGDVYNLFNFKFLSSSGFGDIYYSEGDYRNYVESLHFPKEVYEELGENHFSGDDRLGDYRPTGVDFQPMAYLVSITESTKGRPGVIYYVQNEDEYYEVSDEGEWTQVSKSRIDYVLENRAYIDNPNNTSFTFLSPRDIFIGIRLSYNF